MTALGGNIRVIGARDLQEKLAKLEKKIANKILRQAVRDAAKPMLREAKANAPVSNFDGPSGLSKQAVRQAIRDDKKAGLHYPGMLRDSIKIKAMRSRKGRIGVTIATDKGLFKGETFYGGFQEFGTKHQPARPFIRPAFDANVAGAVTIIAKSLRDKLDLITQE